MIARVGCRASCTDRPAVPVIPLPRLLLLGAALAAGAPLLGAQPLTQATCDTDQEVLLAEIERNRDSALGQLAAAADAATSEAVRRRFEAEREEAWEREERERGLAHQIWRDCSTYVKDQGG